MKKINIKKILTIGTILLSFLSFNNAIAASEVVIESVNDNEIVKNNLPVGSIALWGSEDAPEGWAILNGQSTSGLGTLNQIYGETLIDMRGQFVRSSGGDAAPIGQSQSDELSTHKHNASFSGNALPTHTHTYSAYNGSTKDGGSGGAAADNKKSNYTTSLVSAGTPTGTVIINNEGGIETRPTNIALVFIVKYK